MAHIQLKCRMCRLLLASGESIVDTHGDTVQDVGDTLTCRNLDSVPLTQIFLSDNQELVPQWLTDAIVESCYTREKITCPKCQGRLGSFDFVKSKRRCPCGRFVLPPVHFLCDRVDIVDTNHKIQISKPQERLHIREGQDQLHPVEGEKGLLPLEGGGLLPLEGDGFLLLNEGEEYPPLTEVHRLLPLESGQELCSLQSDERLLRLEEREQLQALEGQGELHPLERQEPLPLERQEKWLPLDESDKVHISDSHGRYSDQPCSEQFHLMNTHSDSLSYAASFVPQYAQRVVRGSNSERLYSGWSASQMQCSDSAERENRSLSTQELECKACASNDQACSPQDYEFEDGATGTKDYLCEDRVQRTKHNFVDCPERLPSEDILDSPQNGAHIQTENTPSEDFSDSPHKDSCFQTKDIPSRDFLNTHQNSGCFQRKRLHLNNGVFDTLQDNVHFHKRRHSSEDCFKEAQNHMHCQMEMNPREKLMKDAENGMHLQKKLRPDFSQCSSNTQNNNSDIENRNIPSRSSANLQERPAPVVLNKRERRRLRKREKAELSDAVAMLTRSLEEETARLDNTFAAPANSFEVLRTMSADVAGASQVPESATAVRCEDNSCQTSAGKRKETGTSRKKTPQELIEEKQAREAAILNTEDVPFEYTCAMCLDIMLNPHTIFPCNHDFCATCLRRLKLSAPVNTKCPLCRETIVRCIPNSDLALMLHKQYPVHLKAKKQQEKRIYPKNCPLPGTDGPASLFYQFQPRQQILPRRFGPSRRKLLFILINVVIVIVISCFGMTLCKHVLGVVAEALDAVLERLTGEKLWSEFMGLESRILTVSTVFVLYLVCACMVKFFRLFQQIENREH